MHSRCSALLQSSGLICAVFGADMCVASCKVGHVSGTQPPARRLPDLGAVDGVSSHLGEVLAANLHRVCPVPKPASFGERRRARCRRLSALLQDAMARAGKLAQPATRVVLLPRCNLKASSLRELMPRSLGIDSGFRFTRSSSTSRKGQYRSIRQYRNCVVIAWKMQGGQCELSLCRL